MARQNKRKASATVASRATTAKKRGTNTTRGRRSSRNATTVVKDNVECAVDDVYEAEDVAVDEEVHRDRYDELDDEYELPEGFEDEEIDEDEAFNSEDERQFGHLFEGGGGKYSDFDSEEEEEDAEGSVEEEDGRGAYDALVSDEDEDDEVWPDLDGGRAGAVVREPDDAFEDGGASRGGYDNGGDLDDDDDDDGDGLDTLGEFDGDKDVRLGREKRVEMIRELYPESIYAVGPGSGRKVTVEELIASTGVSIGQSGDLKAVEKLSKKLKPLEAPLPGPIQARAERRAAYDESKKDIKKWMPLVKSQREAPTLQLTSGRMDAQRPTSVSAMAAKHTPENKMELEVAAMLEAAGAHTASAVAESEEALAMRMLNAEEAKARREELAKQRALLFYHEVKAKRLKKIKSKEYRRRLKKAEKKRQDGVGEDGMLMLGDDELRQQREDAEYERAKERLTLKHKNTSRFIRRAIKRGSQHPDEGTREAIAEQLRLGDEIRRKVHAFKGESEGDSSEGSDDDSSDDERQNERLSRKLESAARDVLEDDDRPDAEKGLLSLPFMKRSMEKQKQRAQQQARKVLHGDAQGNDDDDDDTGDQVRRGRLKFGNGANRSDDANLEEDFNIDDDDDDVEEDAEAKRVRLMSDGSRKATKAVAKASSVAKTDSHDTRSFIPSKTFQGMKDGYVFTKGSNGMGYYAEKRNGAASASNNKLSKPSMPKMPKPQKHSTKSKKVQQQQHGGFSQEDLIRKAFAGDDVVDEFKKSKAEEVEAELPQEEVPGELPGWGTWSNPNKKEPAWVTEAKAKAEAKKAAAAKARKDASMEFVVISEKWDSKNASKYKTQSVPYPFNSKDTYERSMRQPLGKDFNTVDSFRNLTRPAVVKDSGVIIEPLQFSKSVGNHNVGVKMSQRPGIIKVAGGMAKRSGVGR